VGLKGSNPQQHVERSSKGGKAVHAQGRAHEWTLEEAREAGRKGGLARAERMRSRREPPLPPGTKRGG
jgi:general stress protein YciG